MLSAQKIIVDGIYKMVDDSLQNTESLYYAKSVLEDIVEYIEKLLNYWKHLGLSSFSNNWDDKLRGEAQKCLENTYKIIMEEDNVVFERFKNILKLMKMHLSIELLVNIKNHITKGQIRIEGNVNELPKIKFFNDLITELLNVIGSVDNDDSELSHYNFTKQKLNIRAEIEDETITIFKVYPSNSFDQECKKGMAVFENKNGQVRSLKKLKGVGDFNLMNYFRELQAGKFQQELYLDLLKDYRKRIDHTNCVEDYDILSFINSKEANRDACINTANKANYPFIRLSRQLPPNKSMPHFIVCSDTHKISTIIEKFGKNSEFKFKDEPDQKLELAELKNIIVFYDEKGNYIPLTDITYVGQMKEAYEKRPQDLADASETDATWNSKRKAYLTEKKIK
jgi:hypothetical protein